MKKIIQLEDVHISFDKEKPVLRGLNLELSEGETLTVFGAGGSGKSTLLKVIAGIIKPQRGKVIVFGEDINTLHPSEKHAIFKKLSIAFQQGALFDYLTVKENIFFALENLTTLSEAEMDERAKKFIAAVKLPASAANKLPSELSGGMRRRAGIVRALATDPSLALLDEPTSGLDPVTSTTIIDIIHKLGAEMKTTFLCVTSNIDVAFRFSKHVSILKDGIIVGTGSWDELHQLDDPWIHRFLDIRGQNVEKMLKGNTSSQF